MSDTEPGQPSVDHTGMLQDRKMTENQPVLAAEALSTEAHMVSMLLGVGWVIHLTDYPALSVKMFKCVTTGNTTAVEQLEVEVDTILELQRAGKLKRHKQFKSQGVTTTIFTAGE